MTNAWPTHLERELDAYIAEKILGWSYETFPKGPCPYIKHWYSITPCPRNPRDKSFVGGLPLFSTHRETAMGILRIILDRYNCKYGGAGSVKIVWHPYECWWEVEFSWASGHRVAAAAPTIARATCQAAAKLGVL